MADYPFVVDSFYMCGLMDDESNMSMNTNEIWLPEAEPPCPVVDEMISDEENVSRKQRSESSSVVEKLERVKKRKTRNGEGKDASGYIHVRATRGEATALQKGRQKISDRMHILQSLLPGSHKVTGKAVMLDEIINYGVSLHNQVELLSIKLASVNPMLYELIIPQHQQLQNKHINPSAFSQDNAHCFMGCGGGATTQVSQSIITLLFLFISSLYTISK